MIPDNIQANIMKYLNNGVSGSSQEQKPVGINTTYRIPGLYNFPTNFYITEDQQYAVWACRGYVGETEQTEKVMIIVNSVDKILNNENDQVFYVPNYNNQVCIETGDSIDRDEEGRFYGVFRYADSYSQQTNLNYYLLIFNDFLTDGIIQINKAYKLHNYRVPASSPYNATYLDYFHSVKKAKGSGDYYFYQRNASSGSLSNPDITTNPVAFAIVKLSIGVGEQPTTKTWYYNMSSTPANQFKDYQISISLNTETDTPYVMMEYSTDFTQSGGLQTLGNYKVGKAILKQDNNDATKINITQLYTSNEYIGSTDYGNRQYDHNGNYISNLLYKITSTTINIKFLLVRFNGEKIEINGDETFTRYNNRTGENTTITNEFIMLQLTATNPTTYRTYKIDYTNNKLVKIDMTTSLGAYGYVLKQYNLYYIIQPSWPYIYANIVRDVPTYGRDCLLKQKLLNSKLFRAIKKYRNRRANIQ